MLHGEFLLSPQPSLSVPFQVAVNTSQRQAATFRLLPSAPFCPCILYVRGANVPRLLTGFKQTYYARSA